MRTLAITLLMSVSSTAALANDDSFYAGFELGLTKSMDQDLSNPAAGLSLEDHKNLGSLIGVFAGHTYGKWRVEGEFAVRHNYYDRMNVSGTGGLNLDQGNNLAGGDIKSTALMANAWYEFAEFSGWKVLGGAGLGLANVDVNRMRSGKTLVLDDSPWAGAMQGMLQLLHPFDNGIELGFGYRHFRTFGRDFETTLGTSDYKASHNEVFLRLSWRFGASDKPAYEPAPVRTAPEPVAQPEPVAKPQPKPVETPQVVAEPEPVPLPGPFMVFFDFDKADITPEAARIIKAAANAFKQHKAVSLIATGHTDRAGTETYNMRLAERRAAAVKAALEAEGVKASAIKTAAKGENSPLVSTGDGVREPQNRRTEIVLQR